LSQVTEPGYNVKMPFITSFAEVQTTVQTDSIRSIPCGTSGGVLIHFATVEVVNQLEKKHVFQTIKNYTVDYDKTWIFDKIHHEINQFCSKHTLQEVYIDMFDTLDESLLEALQKDCDKYAPGIRIIAVRVTKPVIPESIRQNYEQMEAEKTKLLIATQHQRVVEKEAETRRKKATIEAEQEKEVSAIKMSRQVQEQRSTQEIEVMQNEIHLAREKAITDAIHYKAQQEAEANRLLLTPSYLELERIKGLAKNTKVYFGDSIPKMFSGVSGGDAAAAGLEA